MQPHIEVQSYNLDFANQEGGGQGAGHHQMISTFQKPAQAQYPIEYQNWYEFRMNAKGPERRAYHS